MLKKIFNNSLAKKYGNVQRLCEVDLLKELIKVMRQTDYSYALMAHGQPGMVKHNLSFPHSAPDERVCEIADILMLFFDENNLRYTFLQNKRDKRTKYNPKNPLTKLRADPVQWDLLHYKSTLTDALNTNLPVDCLSSAILSSVATYGIFVNDSKGKTVDMSYSIARDLAATRCNPIPINHHPRTYRVTSDYGNTRRENGYYEIQGTRTLDEFEVAAKAMLVGSPIDFRNGRQRELARTLLSFARTCLINDRERTENTQKYMSIINNFAEANGIEFDNRNEVLLPVNLVIMESKKIFYYTYAKDEARIEFIKSNYGKNATISDSLEEANHIFSNKEHTANYIFLTDLCEPRDLKGERALKAYEALYKIFKDVALFGLLAKDEYGIRLFHPSTFISTKP